MPTSPHKIILTPEEALDAQNVLRSRLGLGPDEPLRILRRAMDARHGVRFEVLVEVGQAPSGLEPPLVLPERPVAGPVVILGAGPAGLFCALGLAAQGISAVVVDQGLGFPARHQQVRSLRLWGRPGPAGLSSLLHGLGGAGAYSDGKLHTRKRTPEARLVLDWLSWYGNDPELRIDTHPHVGSNRLPRLVDAMRQQLERFGTRFRLGTPVAELLLQEGRAIGVVTKDGEAIQGEAVVLAPGNNARPLFEALVRQRVAVTAKPLAIGVRVEHPRAFVDQARLGRYAGHEAIGAARYEVACQVGERGVYSFCMCPGGYVIPTPPEQGRLAVNGMSFSTRSSSWSNAAMVVTVGEEDVDLSLPLSMVAFQRSVEALCWEAGGGAIHAPAQRMADFLAGRDSAQLPQSSYLPGLTAARLDRLLPAAVVQGLKASFAAAEKSIPGYRHPEALLIGPETLTSSPVQLPRDTRTLESLSTPGLYPSGEGGGWAGGITSSAADGWRVARSLGRRLLGGE